MAGAGSARVAYSRFAPRIVLQWTILCVHGRQQLDYSSVSVDGVGEGC